MAEVKSGVNYEITADDKASAVADKASKNVQRSSKEAGEAFKGEFNPMSAVLAGISGNTQALAQQMLGLVSRMKSVHMTMMKFSLYAALVMAIVKAVGVLMEKFAEARTKADQIKLDKAAGALENCNKEQARLNEQLDQAREKSSQIHSNLMSELDATQKLTAARREYTKALELSLAKTEEEKAAIERRHAAEGAKDKTDFDAQRNKAKREKTLSDIASWEEQIRDYEDTLAMQRKSAKWAQNAQASAGKKDLAALTDQESQAAARLAAAQSKVAEAWGWYRDKDKMAAQLKEEKAEAEAQKQFEKDFEDLKWRRDWRTAKDLSVDQEAVRRVALAKEEETAAQKALAETAKSTAKAAASLAEIEKVITQEG